jgi:hypothetical protein
LIAIEALEMVGARGGAGQLRAGSSPAAATDNQRRTLGYPAGPIDRPSLIQATETARAALDDAALRRRGLGVAR